MLNAPGKIPHLANQQAGKDAQSSFFTAPQSGAPFFAPAVQTKLEVNEPGDAYEKEADAMADKIVAQPVAAGASATDNSGFIAPTAGSLQLKPPAAGHGFASPPALQRKSDAPGTASGHLSPQLGQGGAPMDAGVRSGMESHFGTGFGNVKVHTDSNAVQMSRGLSAQAFTHGNDIYFNEGKYSPGTSSGKHLLAHELTHVVQQSGGIRRKPDPAVPDYHTTAEKLWEDEQKIYFNQERVEHARRYVVMTGALVEGDVAALPGAVKDFLENAPFRFPLGYPSSDHVSEIVIRLLSLGLTKESADIRSWFPNHQRAQHEPERDKNSLEIYFAENIFDHAPDVTKLKTVAEADSAADVYVRLIDQMSNEQKGIGKERVQEEIKRRSKETYIDDPFGNFPRADHTFVGHYRSLTQLMKRAFEHFQIAYQLILEAAISDLEKGNGDATLKIARAKLVSMTNVNVDPEVAFGELDLTKTEYKRGKDDYIESGKHVDYFLEEKEARKRSVAINLYDPATFAEPSEKQATLTQIMETRLKQIGLLEHLYGFGVDDKGQKTAGTIENADAIKKAGGLQLHSNDDWRKFALEKFELHKATSNKAEAYVSVIRLLEQYLKVFTMHTPANIEDWGDNQLKINFPRALTGQLVHDCGVYALRIVYILQLMRTHPDLKLNIRFIRLPVHTGLIIEGDGLPAFIVHNDQFMQYSAQQLATLEADWQQKSADAPYPVPADPAAAHTQFLGEMAAEEFITSVDMPFRIEDAPTLSGTTADIATLWAFYQKTVMPDVFSKDAMDPKHPDYNYHLKYLDLLETFKRFYNDDYRRFWNGVLMPAFNDKKDALLKADEKAKKAKPGPDKVAADKEFETLFAEFEGKVKPEWAKVEAAFTPVFDKATALGMDIKNKPSLLGKGATLSNSTRALDVLGGWPESVFDTQIARRDVTKEDARGKQLPPMQ